MSRLCHVCSFGFNSTFVVIMSTWIRTKCVSFYLVSSTHLFYIRGTSLVMAFFAQFVFAEWMTFGEGKMSQPASWARIVDQSASAHGCLSQSSRRSGYLCVHLLVCLCVCVCVRFLPPGYSKRRPNRNGPCITTTCSWTITGCCCWLMLNVLAWAIGEGNYSYIFYSNNKLERFGTNEYCFFNRCIY